MRLPKRRVKLVGTERVTRSRPRAAEVSGAGRFGSPSQQATQRWKLSDSGTNTNTDAANAAAEANPNLTGDAASNGAHRRGY